MEQIQTIKPQNPYKIVGWNIFEILWIPTEINIWNDRFQHLNSVQKYYPKLDFRLHVWFREHQFGIISTTIILQSSSLKINCYNQQQILEWQ